jgi:hypothetical protein
MTQLQETPDQLARRQAALARHQAHVKDLLDRRADLAGAIALADLVRDSSTWAA